jgi:seryl-tRNA synthetase
MKPLRIDIEIPAFLHRDVEHGVFYCSEKILEGRVDRDAGSGIDLELADDADTESIESTVRGWIEQTIQRSLRYEDDVLQEWGEAAPFRSETEEILASKDLKVMGNGLVSYGPRYTRILQSLLEICEQLSASVEAEPFMTPAVATVEHLQRCDFLAQFPQAISFVTHFREDHSVIDRFAEQCRGTDGAVDCQPPAEHLKPFGMLLRPAVCYHIYPYFEGETLDRDPYLACAVGDCFRYESRNTTGIDRLFDFRLYEIVGLGSDETLQRWREGMIAEAVEIFTDLGLPGRIAGSNDPFFAAGSILKSTFQRAHALKYELEVPFPNREGRLAVASFNLHRDFFGTRFDIQTPSREVASTGCVGYGLDRILSALLVHHGLDLEQWPQRCRERLGIRA